MIFRKPHFLALFSRAAFHLCAHILVLSNNYRGSHVLMEIEFDILQEYCDGSWGGVIVKYFLPQHNTTT